MFEELAQEGIDTELVELADKPVQGCIACYKCFKNKDARCAVDNDIVNEAIGKMQARMAFCWAHPLILQMLPANMKGLIERCGMVSRANGDLYKR